MMGEWLVAGVVFCVLPAVVMRSWCWEDAHKKRSEARDGSWHNVRPRGHEGLIEGGWCCVPSAVCCDIERQLSCYHELLKTNLLLATVL